MIVGVAAHHSADVTGQGMRDQIQIDDDLGGMFGTAYTFDDTLEQQFPAKGSLRIVCDRGAINVTPSDGNTIRVVVHKKLYAKNQDDANKLQRRQQAANHSERHVGGAERQHQWRRRSRRAGRHGHLRADATPRSMWPASAATSQSMTARPT